MTTENEKKVTDKGLLNPDEVGKQPKKDKKISVDKNDIVERESSIMTDDGRQLLK